MDESRHYTIEITCKDGGQGKTSASKAVSGSTTKSAQQKVQENTQADSFNKSLAVGLVAYRTIKPFVTQTINHEVSLVELRTGSSRLQERANFVNQVVQQGIGIAESVGLGAMVGGLPGALAGLALGTAHTLIGYAQNQQRLDVQKSVENESLEMQYIRAGAGGSRHRE